MLKMIRNALMVALLLSAAVVSQAQNSHAFGKARPDLPELEVVQDFQVGRYLGLWYEIAAIPQSFQKGCTGTTAEYSLINEKTVRVVNRCFVDSLEGELKVAHGKAKIPDLSVPSKLSVSFFWPFSGDYWVIELGGDYEYSVVGHPSRDYLWILSRSPHMEESQIQEILDRQALKGYDISRVKRTIQP